jgi:hypothetical protein
MIATLLAKFWPVIVGIAGIAGSFLFAWVSKKAADARVARAQQQRAQAQADVASTREASAEANAAAAQAGEEAAVNARPKRRRSRAISSMPRARPWASCVRSDPCEVQSFWWRLGFRLALLSSRPGSPRVLPIPLAIGLGR